MKDSLNEHLLPSVGASASNKGLLFDLVIVSLSYILV